MSEGASIELSKEMGPSWFASVMGTGIIANTAVGFPFIGDKLTPVAIAIWLVATLILALLVVQYTVHFLP